MNTPLIGLVALVMALGAGLPVQAAGPSASADARARAQYQRDQASCMKLRVHGERANCLSEASTAYDAALPAVPDSDSGRYARNAIERCKVLPDADRGDCIKRMQGQGTISGSVAGGGVYRELVTREVTPPPPPR